MGPMAERIVLLAGATGLVGGECLRRLAADPDITEVRALVRRPLPPEGRLRRVTEVVTDFDRLDASNAFNQARQVVCALGTTMRQAGSQDAFRRVDHDYPLALARLARAHGASHFLLVSAMGASASSRMFYNRVKGEVESAILTLGYPSVTIVRPSLLLGERAEFRLGEEIARRLSFLTPDRYKPVAAAQVAEAVVRAAREDRPGVRIIENPELRRTA